MTAPAAPAPSPAGKPGAKKSSKGLVLGLLATLLVVAAGVGAYFYFGVVQHEPEAHKHVPPKTRLALRVDGMEVATFKPVRDHLWPVLLEDTDGGEQPESERVDRIEEHTGIAIPTDLREVVIAATGATDVVVLIGGKIEPGRFVPGMKKVFDEEGVSGWSIKDGLLVHSTRLALAQAEDGTLIMATNSKLARACLPETKEGQRLPLPVKSAISFGLTHQAYDDALKAIPIQLPGTEALTKVDTVSGHMTLSEKPQLIINGVPRQGVQAQALASDMQSLLAKLQLSMLLMPGDLGGAKSAIRNAEVKPRDKDVRITTSWPYEPLDKAAKQLAEAIRRGRAVSE